MVARLTSVTSVKMIIGSFSTTKRTASLRSTIVMLMNNLRIYSRTTTVSWLVLYVNMDSFGLLLLKTSLDTASIVTPTFLTATGVLALIPAFSVRMVCSLPMTRKVACIPSSTASTVCQHMTWFMANTGAANARMATSPMKTAHALNAVKLRTVSSVTQTMDAHNARLVSWLRQMEQLVSKKSKTVNVDQITTQ